MCGILGGLNIRHDEVFENALSKLTHRGPDGYGIWQNPENNVCFGHRRLSILDLSENAKQPMSYGNLTITYNGEIYNFIELRAELKKKGYQFQTESDTEVILVSFIEWGKDCLLKFNGMWAFAIWNNQNKKLFLARDRFGKKPLFYSFVNDSFVFASEMKAIFPFLPEIKPSQYFEWCIKNAHAYEITEKTLIDRIFRFPSASYAYLSMDDIESKKIDPNKYWNTTDHLVDVPEKYEDQVARFRELFEDACRIRMRSDVSIGTALSGGLDSSSTICTMAHVQKKSGLERVNNDWQHAFVATFANTFLDESYYAQKVVDYLNIPATFLPIDPNKAIDKLEDYIYLFEEIYPTSPVPMMELYRSVREHNVKVTLDGHGADELFSSYGRSLFITFFDAGLNFRSILEIIKTFNGLNDIEVSNKNHRADLTTYFKFMYRNLGLMGMVKFYLSQVSRLHSNQKVHALNEHFNQHLYQVFHQTILPTLLRNYDRYSMANGVEIRMPFMDYRLVTYVFSLSWRSKIRKGFTKAILRDSLQDIMPKEVVERKSKIGFSTPIIHWMKNQWKEYFLDIIHSSDFNNSSLINSTEVRDKIKRVIFEENVSTYTDGEDAWMAISPYLWERSFLKQTSKSKILL